ncbi:MAG: hypothetical protein HXY25_03590, partial [Alphaproteobacteria bacterium]|nr:hypothetical protein [Alphaproteobacteria bacterium]
GERRGRGGRRSEEDAVVGLGEHVPAFLLRPVKTSRLAPLDSLPEEDVEDKAGDDENRTGTDG